MTTSYPSGLDTFTNPAPSEKQDSPPHHSQHADANDAIEAIEAELGTNPKGSGTSVKDRLDTADTTIAAKAAKASNLSDLTDTAAARSNLNAVSVASGSGPSSYVASGALKIPISVTANGTNITTTTSTPSMSGNNAIPNQVTPNLIPGIFVKADYGTYNIDPTLSRGQLWNIASYHENYGSMASVSVAGFAKGDHVFAGNFVAYADSSGGNPATAIEIDYGRLNGSAATAYGLTIVACGTQTGTGAPYSAIGPYIQVQANDAGYAPTYGIRFHDRGASGEVISSSGTLMYLDGGSMAKGLDLAAGTFSDSALSLGNNNIRVGTSTGCKIGTATTQKLGFFNATPIVQPSSTTDLRTALINLGLYASGGATPLDLNLGALTAGATTVVDGTASHGKITFACGVFGGIFGIFGDTGDTTAKMSMTNAGIAFGPGGSSATDVGLSRTGTAAMSATGQLTISDGLTFADAKNIVINTTTGTKIGTGATQKIGFWNATPVARPTGWTSPTGTVSRTGYATGTATLTQVAQNLAALIADLTTIGVIGA